MDLTDYKSASARRARGKATAMDVFVTEYEPNDMDERAEWRRQLAEAVEYEVWNEMLSTCVKQDIMLGELMLFRWKRDMAFYLFTTVAIVALMVILWIL